MSVAGVSGPRPSSHIARSRSHTTTRVHSPSRGHPDARQAGDAHLPEEQLHTLPVYQHALTRVRHPSGEPVAIELQESVAEWLMTNDPDVRSHV